MNRILKLTISLILIAIMIPITEIYAAIPNDTIIIGDKAYSLGYINKNINDANFSTQINKQIANSKNKKIYYVDAQSGKIVNIFDKLKDEIPANEIANLPSITYLDEQGNQINFAAGNGEKTEEWFPYTTSWKDTVADVAIDGSIFLDAPAGKHGFVKAKGEHFCFEDGTPIRFWGTNLTFGACFPTHANAEILARQLAKCGFNAVRFHHMDSQFAPTGIIDKKTQKFSQEQLDRLDYLVYQLKLNGIYSDLNLHVGRNYSGISEVVDNNKLPQNSKEVTLFDDTIISLEKDYAKNLLTHFNQYTNTKYCDEPAICFVEIANEDSLFSNWTSGNLFCGNNQNNLTEYYAKELDNKWNDYLKNKYQTQENLENAWKVNNSSENDFVINGSFENDLGKSWVLEKHQGITANVLRDSEDKYDGNYSVRVDADVVDSNVSYKLQLKQIGIKVEKGKKYRVEFYSKADKGRSIDVSFGREVSPYNNYGLYNTVSLTQEWKKYSLSFEANETTDDLTRLSFVLGSSTGKVWFDNVTFKEINDKGLLQDETLEKGNISRLKWSERNDFVVQKVNDTIDFYYELERKFFSEMVSYVHKDLGVKSLVSTTNSYYGQPNLMVQQDGDYIDSHIYWDHPSFPNKSWDIVDFKQNNLSLINRNFLNKTDMGNGFLDRLGLSATKGKPMVVSEWNYVFPNDYEYEGPNVAMAYASLQDYDGMFVYEYASGTKGEIYSNSNSSEYINNWFDIEYNPGKKAQMLQCAIAFYRGDIKPAQKEIVENYNNDFAMSSYRCAQYNDVLADGKRLPQTAFYNYKIRKQFNQNSTSTLNDLLNSTEIDRLNNAKVQTSDTEEIKWDASISNKEYVSINTDKFQSLNGFIAGIELSLKNLTANVSKDCAIGLISLDGMAIENSSRMLLTVVGKQHNANSERTALNGLSNWGTSPVLMQKVGGTIKIIKNYNQGEKYTVYALNNKGERVIEKDVIMTPNVASNEVTLEFNIGDSALYYEIVLTRIFMQ